MTQCLAALHETFGGDQRLCSDGAWPPSNDALHATLDVILCTTGAHHLVPSLPRHLFTHCDTSADPRLLGFACQHLMRERQGQYDYYGYLEDDIAVTDPLFFTKLAWFGAEFGPAALLQPNRYEADPRLSPKKLYVDGNLRDKAAQARFQDIAVRPKLSGRTLGREWQFQRVDNVHSGCFFLESRQLDRAIASPDFANPSQAFIGPLESAATLMIMRNFDVYKPARQTAGFLEVRHLDNRSLLPPAGAA